MRIESIKLDKNLLAFGFLVISIITVFLAYYNRQTGAVSLIFDKGDTYMDLVNTIYSSCRKDVYTSLGNVYPPALLLALNTLFQNSCKEGMESATLLRLSILSSLLISHFLLILANGLVIGIFARKTSGSKYIEWICIIIACLWPPTLFCLDRMNTILLPYYLLLISAILSLNTGKKFIQSLKTWNRLKFSSILLGICIKPYFILQYILSFAIDFMGYRRAVSIKHLTSAKYTIGLSLILLLNILPFFIGTYHGSILSWIQNLASFEASTSISPSNIWNMNYYSLSIYSASKLYPISSLSVFLEHPVTGNSHGIMIISLIIQTMFMVFVAIKLIRLIFFATHKVSDNIETDTQIMLIDLMAITLSITLFSSLIPSSGYYLGIFWVFSPIIAICTGSKKDITIMSLLAIIFMYFSSSSTGVWQSASIPSLVSLYTLMCFSSAVSVHHLTRRKAPEKFRDAH